MEFWEILSGEIEVSDHNMMTENPDNEKTGRCDRVIG